MRGLEAQLKALIKKLPRRVFEQDRDQTWNLSLDGMTVKADGDSIRAMGKVVPIYQSGWEGVGIFMSVTLAKESTLSEIAKAMVADAKVKIFGDSEATSFTGCL